jgi:hypothetical protein
VEEKSTLELMKEKEETIKKLDEVIRNSSRESMRKHIEERDKMRAEKQEKEDKGWGSSQFWVLPKMEEPKVIPKPKKPKKLKKVILEEAVETMTDIVEKIKEEKKEPVHEELTEIEKQKLIEKHKAELEKLLGE